MLDKNLIGHRMGKRSILVEEGAVRAYAKAIGETDTTCLDVEAARAAGLRSLRVPPTYLSCMQGQLFATTDTLKLARMDLKRILHAEQAYEYLAPVCAGDTLTYEPRIADVYDKKDGALEFLVMQTCITNQDGVHVADLRSVVVQRRI